MAGRNGKGRYSNVSYMKEQIAAAEAAGDAKALNHWKGRLLAYRMAQAAAGFAVTAVAVVAVQSGLLTPLVRGTPLASGSLGSLTFG